MTIAEAVRAAIAEWLADGVDPQTAYEQAEEAAMEAAGDALADAGYDFDEDQCRWVKPE